MKTRIFLSTIILLSGFGSMAQDKVPGKLTFKEAVKIGLDNNVSLKQQENLLISSKVAKVSGLMAMGPSVAINGNAGRNDGNSFNQNQGRVINGVLDFARASVDANVPIIRGLGTLNTNRQMSNQYDAQLHSRNQTSQDVIRDISRQYLQCLLDDRIVQINEKNVETQQRQYDQIREHVNAGSRAEVDLKNQEYQVKNAELTLLRAKNTLRNDKAALARTLALDPTTPFDVEEPSWGASELDAATMDYLYQTASERRNDLAQARHSEKAAKFGFYAARGAYFPSVSGFASYGSAYNYIHATPEFAPENRTFDQQFFTDNTQLTYGITFRVPIYGAFFNRATVARNRALYENAKLQAEATELNVKSEVQLAYQNWRDAQAALEATQAQLDAAKTAFDLETERYTLGISDIVTLTLSNQAHIRAQGDFESARYTLMFQKLLMNYAIGTLKFEDIP